MMWSGNFQSTYNLLVAIRLHCKESLLVFASSSECYGTTFIAEDFVTEESALQPLNAYGRSKASSEYLIRDIHHGPFIVLRLFNQIGAGQDERFVTSSFAAQIARIERELVPPRISVGDLSAERDFCDVEDMVEALAGLLDVADQMDRASTFNICSGTTRSIRSVLDILLSLTKVEVSVEIDPSRLRPLAIARAGGSSASIQATTGWAPKIPITQTLENLLNHWRLS
jgi:GDP-4-dehydro-6-deoxy-D-mannose reductase